MDVEGYVSPLNISRIEGIPPLPELATHQTTGLVANDDQSQPVPQPQSIIAPRASFDALNWIYHPWHKRDENPWFEDTGELVTNSTSSTFTLGTGHGIFQTICPTILANCRRELIMVFCSWSRSTSSDMISEMLRRLSTRAVEDGDGKIQVRICVSTLSFGRRLFKVGSEYPSGKIHSPKKQWITTPSRFGKTNWARKLGLPAPDELPGLNLQVKSISISPLFTVLHPRYILMDRDVVFLPSCNVSFLNRLEGCIDLRGPVVQCFLRFWDATWCGDNQEDWDLNIKAGDAGTAEPFVDRSRLDSVITLKAHDMARLDPTGEIVVIDFDSLPPPDLLPVAVQLREEANIETLLLPAQFHRHFYRPAILTRPNRRSQLIGPPPLAPPTPLNIMLLQSFERARINIFIQTTEFTSLVVRQALKNALARGVDVDIITNKNHEDYVGKLAMDQRDMCRHYDYAQSGICPGHLNVRYLLARKNDLNDPAAQQHLRLPVSSHLNLTIVDGRVTILGSGSMGRASWYTNQELSIALFSEALATTVRDAVERVADEYSMTVIGTPSATEKLSQPRPNAREATHGAVEQLN